MGAIAGIIDQVAYEAMLFAAAGFLLGGIDDLAVDLIFLARNGWRRVRRHGALPTLAGLRLAQDGRLAVFVAAWDEAAVIGAMLSTALARFEHDRYRLYVGCYPNDRATIDAVARVAEHDARVRVVINQRPGPTTKADCLNALWCALVADDRRDGEKTRAVVLHDAEDVVHPGELAVFDALIGDHAMVQLPVLPLAQVGSRLVSGHYLDEFAEAHAKSMVVRELVGAGLPLAGVGCAIAVPMLARIADDRGGAPFDETSLTEDYELGLHVAALGGRATLARVSDGAGGLVAVHAYFPATVHAAVVQKARWMVGIALAGWDRVGWGRWRDLGDHWMRLRDRRAPLAVAVLASAYLALLAWAIGAGAHRLAGTAVAPVAGWLALLLRVNAVLLGWRLAVRTACTASAYGWREARWSVPRALVGNLIAILAARRALTRYVASLRGRALTWDKTAHQFPDQATVAAIAEP